MLFRSNYSYIDGATASSYTATDLTQTTYYRAVVKSGVCDSALTNVVTITVSPATVAGTISGATTVCTGTNSTTLRLNNNVGTIQWQSSMTLNGTYTNIAQATGSTYLATNLTDAMYYRAVVTSGACSLAYSDTVMIAVDPAAIGGNVLGDTAISAGFNSIDRKSTRLNSSHT